MVGKGEKIDTIQWASIRKQIYQYPPIEYWDPDSISKKMIYIDGFNELREQYKDRPKRFIETHKVVKKKKWKIKRKVETLIYGYDQEIWPHAYGIRIAYPILFEYDKILYGFTNIDLINFREDSYNFYRTTTYLCKWNNKNWRILISDHDRGDRTMKIDKYLKEQKEKQ